MIERRTETAVAIAAVGYLVVLAWLMASVSYNLWSALVAAPILLLVGVAGLRRMFTGSQTVLVPIMIGGLALKLCGAVTRYWVSFEAYGGSTDAQRYHTFGARAASSLWAGDGGWSDVVPRGLGTEFLEGFTAMVYALTGTGRLGGFLVFAWLSYWGVALFVKSAVIAIPGLARRQYAAVMAVAPSIVFWPSSIGKEAYMLLTLGIATFGIARAVSRPGLMISGLITAGGLGAAAFVRPHIVGVWAAGLLPGLLVVLTRGRSGAVRRTGRRGTDALAAVVLIVVATVGLSFIAQATVDYLAPVSGEEVSTSSLTDILSETARRTSKGDGSTFEPPSISSPIEWPVASLRTLFRPTPFEARGFGQLLAAAELVAFGVLCAVSWRRVRQLPRLVVTNPYVAFAIATLLLGGLAYASFGNLGVLTRQKSLVFPFLLLIPCLPNARTARVNRPPLTESAAPVPRRPGDADRVTDQNSSTSPSESDQLDSGGIPAVAASRQVRIGPPPGSGTDLDDADLDDADLDRVFAGPKRMT